MSADKKPITKGHRYFFGIHMGVGRWIDVLKEIRVGGRTAWKGAKAGQARWKITSATLFGGDDGEGGIHGTIDMMTGASDQPVNRRLRNMLGGLVPAFRGACTLFYDGLVTSMSPYPKPWEIRVARTTGGWDGATWYLEKATIALGSIQAMNPAHILFEAITNRDWGWGKDRSLIDDVQWRAAADALYSEAFGLCLAWKSQDKISTFIQSILDHIGAAVVLNRRSAKLQLLLIRDDYVAADLPLFDEDSGLLGIADDENTASAPAANEIIVTFTNPEAYGAQQQVRVQNAAAISAVGGPITETLEFLHLPTASLALRVAQRVLREKSVSKRLKVTLDRRGNRIQPGSPFRIRSVRRGIAEMVVRAGKVEDGTLASGAITVTAMQDAFGLPSTSFVEVQPPEWVPPATGPIPAAVRKPFELSYRDLAIGLAAGDLAALHPTACAFGIMVRRPTNASINYVLLTKSGGVEYNAAATGDFCPSAQIIDAIGYLDTAIKLTFVTEIDGFTPGAVGVIDDETVQLVSVDWMTGDAVIRRGCVDTVPAPHAAGARIWFYTESAAIDQTEYATGMSVDAKVLPYSSGGWLDAALAAVDTLLMRQRQYRPYPPGNFRIGGHAYPETVEGAVVLSWAHRDRILGADQIVDTTQPNIGPEAGTTYSARLLRADTNAVLITESGIAGSTVTLGASYSGDVTVELWSVRDGIESWQRQRHTFSYESLAEPDPLFSTVELLLHFDGTLGETTFVEQKAGRTPVRVGAVLLSDAQHVFGGTSLRKQAGGYLSWARDTWTNGLTYDAEWTFEARSYIDVAPTGDVNVGVFEAIGSSTTYSAGLYFQRYLGNWYAYCYAQGSDMAYVSAALPISHQTWHGLRLVCSGTGGLVLLIDGAVIPLSSFSFGSRLKASEGFLLGTARASLGSNELMAGAGYLDEVRFGRASRGTAPYSLDTMPFPDA